MTVFALLGLGLSVSEVEARAALCAGVDVCFSPWLNVEKRQDLSRQWLAEALHAACTCPALAAFFLC